MLELDWFQMLLLIHHQVSVGKQLDQFDIWEQD